MTICDACYAEAGKDLGKLTPGAVATHAVSMEIVPEALPSARFKPPAVQLCTAHVDSLRWVLALAEKKES